MQHMAVTVVFDAEQHASLDVFRSPPMGESQARAWLDAQFHALGCQPLRASGKVLLADKLLLVAKAVGAQHSDSVWWDTYARAAQAVLAKPRIRVDVAAMSVAY